MKNKITIHLASPRGFCAGVDRAIEIVKKIVGSEVNASSVSAIVEDISKKEIVKYI